MYRCTPDGARCLLPSQMRRGRDAVVRPGERTKPQMGYGSEAGAPHNFSAARKALGGWEARLGRGRGG
jgi:hypothetical protein